MSERAYRALPVGTVARSTGLVMYRSRLAHYCYAPTVTMRGGLVVVARIVTDCLATFDAARYSAMRARRLWRAIRRQYVRRFER